MTLIPPKAGCVAVTGSASGLGAVVATRRRDLGHHVVGIDRHEADVVADLATAAGRAHAVDEIGRHCDGTLEGVVSCAALSPLHPDPAAVVSVNCFGALAVLDGLLPALARGDAPAAVAVASIAAVDGIADPVLLELLESGDEHAARTVAADGTAYRSVVTYSTTKRALCLAVRHRCAAWADAGVRLNVVAPGPMRTPMLDEVLADDAVAAGVATLPVGLRSTISTTEAAAVVEFLLSPDAAAVHGQVVFVDGGTEALLRPDAL